MLRSVYLLVVARPNGSLVPPATDVRHWMQRAPQTRLVAGRAGPAVRRS
jgi:hypothetical protein